MKAAHPSHTPGVPRSVVPVIIFCEVVAAVQAFAVLPSSSGTRRTMLVSFGVLVPAGGVFPFPAWSTRFDDASNSLMPSAELESETVVVTTSIGVETTLFGSFAA